MDFSKEALIYNPIKPAQTPYRVNLHRLEVLDFRLEHRRELILDAGWVAFSGPNGCGKTNLLDAIHYLCLGRSYFTRQDGQLVRIGQRGFRIEGHFKAGYPLGQTCNLADHSRESAKVTVVFKPGTPKELTLDDVPYKRISEHLGKFPAVMVTPGDLLLIDGGSTDRRKWLDMMLAQVYPDYVSKLLRRDHFLGQRNALLKAAGPCGQPDSELISLYDEELTLCHEAIHLIRLQWQADFGSLVETFYAEMAGLAEPVQIRYLSDWEVHRYSRRRPNLNKEIEAGLTLWGTQRDDVEFLLEGQSVKRYASQGQRKSLVLALKLAQCRYFVQSGKGFVFLLVDDVFEKLDQSRLRGLATAMQALTGEGVRVFLTDTDADRIQVLMQTCNQFCQISRLP
jgi:DNA replication and repair protein RecF